MPRRQRFAVYTVFGVLWVSGCWWLLLDEFFTRPGQFGSMPHPWEPAILLIHGIVAILSMYVLGWVSARHVLRWWPARLRRLSGGLLTRARTCASRRGSGARTSLARRTR